MSFPRTVLCSICCVLLLATSTVAATMIDDFSGGVTAVNHPNPADGGTDAYGVYYDVHEQAFATASAGTLSGDPALHIEDGGFTNGVYAIYEAVVPDDGMYTLSADMLVNDTATSGMSAYQLGVIVNGVHRGPNVGDDPRSVIADASIFGDYTGLNADALDATTIQNVVTGEFSAAAGDDLLIVFSTDVTTGYDSNAVNFNGATIDVDNIQLSDVIPEPGAFTLLLAGLGSAPLLRRRGS